MNTAHEGERRRSGIIVPLFSLASRQGWGMGEFGDLPAFARWLLEAGQSVVQILPIHEMPSIETSPYSAMTSMALDPIYISMSQVQDFTGIGGELALDGAEVAEVARLRQSPRVEYSSIRRLKERWLRRSFDRFQRLEVARGTPRALRFDAFTREQSWWLDEYALFRALHALHEGLPWTQWPEPVSKADPRVLAEARAALYPEITYRKYLQWLAADQWADAKRLAWPIAIYGDLPFMISSDSPDVWARQDEFRFDATVGVPPDAFSETGQDWGLPPWRASVMATNDFRWMRARARRYADLYDGYRIDHLVGLYRMYVRPLDKSIPAFFDPAEEQDQLRLGETLVSIFTGASASLGVIAEDLGSVPPFVRESMARLNLPGLKVLRWEKHWDREGQPPIDPAQFPERSVATTGTHDIEPLAATPEGNTDEKRDAILQSLLSSGSNLTLMPVQDVFGWPDRINTPAVVDGMNWTWRLPWPVDTWLDREDTVAHADQLKIWTRSADR
ncbi:MAG TPA: 4-alpha-glucanotransferase [Vicinamibacterales bacterium]|nr:4-alpha-glucanotransferase [Vicinamibacterales bacterium]